jgi:CheY-like chemotaxis protein
MKIVLSNNAFVYDELASPGFQQVKPEAFVVSSGDEALAAVKLHAPELAVLDAEMPGLDGYTVCERLKSDRETRKTRVILVAQGAITGRQLQRLAACGCDDVMVFRLPGEDLYRHVSRMLGLPDLSLDEPREMEVTISPLPEERRTPLAAVARWDPRERPEGVQIKVRGAWDEKVDFSGIARVVAAEMVFDLAGVRSINSWGARQWILFLRGVPTTSRYCFVNAAEVFVKHCNMVADMLGRGSMVSFVAPYECASCGGEKDRILQTSSMSLAVRHDPPEFRCGACGGVERFADLPDRYFAFLRESTTT